MSEVLPRYALYYAPRPEEALAVIASQWLGCTPDAGRAHRLPLSSGLDPRRLAEITAEPRRYGFHGTLKPPMALIDDVSEADFLAAVGRFAASQRTFNTPSLALAELSGFLALVPTAPLTGAAGPRRPLRHRVRRVPPARRRRRAGAAARGRPLAAAGRAAAALGLSLCPGGMALPSDAHRPAFGCRRADGGDERPAPAVFASGRPSAAGARSLRFPAGRARPGLHRAGALQARRRTADEG